MPRRRAVRLLGGAFVAVALPGLSARQARAALTRGAGPCPPGGQQTCAEQFGPEVSECCSRPIPGSGNYTCCKPGECFYSPTTNTCCPKARQCDTRCCPEGDKCKDGRCISCPDERECGKTCCSPREFCGSKLRSLCCPNGYDVCVAPKKALGRCCNKPGGEECCFSPTGVDCCKTRQGQKCRNGRCLCPDGKPSCGGECCPKGKYCSKGVCCKTGRKNCGDGFCCGAKKGQSCSGGKCCPDGKVNCGDNRCCEKEDCCEKICCDGKSRICAGGKCCPGERLLGTGKNARCCPTGTVPSASACCPENDPECCSDEGLALLCPKGSTCVRGKCTKL